MPSFKKRITTSSQDILSTELFANVPAGGAILNIWGAGVTATDDVEVLIGDKQIVPQMDLNIEASADVIDTDRDQIVFNEMIPGGRLQARVNVTTECQLLFSLKYL